MLIPALRMALLGRAVPSRPATLLDHDRRRVRGRRFPAVFAAAGSSVEGALIRVGPSERRILDFYESDFYRRIAVRILVGRHRRRICAHAYVLPVRDRDLLADADWDPATYRGAVLARTLRRAFFCARDLRGYHREG